MIVTLTDRDSVFILIDDEGKFHSAFREEEVAEDVAEKEKCLVVRYFLEGIVE